MPVTVDDLLREREFALTALVRGAEPDAGLVWASSSDLADPTPFLAERQLVLTTGSQFAAAEPGSELGAVIDAYVARLAAIGVVGVGFGTEVVRAGTPDELVEACRRHGLTLLEVPYRTPFLAISRWLAARLEREARARDEWALAAQRAISAAALGAGGVAAVLDELARRLDARVLLFGESGAVRSAHPRSAIRRDGDVDARIAAEAARLLSAGRRAGSELEVDGAHVWFQTLGSGGRLDGVIAGVAATGSTAPDRPARAVVAGAVALTEVAAGAAREAVRLARALRRRALVALLAGRRDDAVGLLAELGASVPNGAVTVVVARLDEVAADRALAVLGDALAAELDGRLVLVAETPRAAALAPRLTALGAAVGTAAQLGVDALEAGVARAGTAARRAAPGEIADWAALPDEPLGLALGAGGLRELAAARLGPLEDDPASAELLRCARVWLQNNGAWDAAARELGIHRHSLRDRMTKLEHRLGVDLARFDARAELWMLLRARDAATP
ncbi:PucR family transcriptional regulator [Schumannella luteola]|uniref:Purine catabolism regulator n=1 Tax=Schumannella luteola TaxID=472059 RepID=A0A852YJE7_9MICO|nr:PucR family transcriptional regulator [Schumannella luteola]NYG99258.1 purine catabolism regulator [Schumannella luteola]TPX05641.1 PucR family transcriptional regulator [Schumannella luteola]